MSDGFIQAPPDSTGKLVDAEQTTNSNNATVERLRVAISEGADVSGSDILQLIYTEMRTTNDILAQSFGLNVDELRAAQENANAS